MTEQQQQFCAARERLIEAVAAIGFPAELAELCAKQIGSPKGIDRLTCQVRPRSAGLLVDEMSGQIKTWREKKKSEEAQWKYTLWLNSDDREE